MILITGAAGKTGLAVIRSLVAKGVDVRAWVYRPEQKQVMESLGAKEIIVGDMRSLSTAKQALRGVQAVYHICPNVHPDEVEIGQVLITAAQKVGLNYFVFHSVLHPQVEAMPHHWKKLRVEEMLLASGLSFTILQPAAYMQNILIHWQKISTEGVYPIPYAAQTRISMVDLEDVAQVASLVLTEPGHGRATYELVGSEALSQLEVVAVLRECLGRSVRVEVVSGEEWEKAARSSGLGTYAIETLVKMFAYYEQYGFEGNSRVLEWLLGRPVTTFASFVLRVAREQSQRVDKTKRN
ncbi:MAG: NmrA family NAD(P)-binding protein [Chloroflexota bacterium]